MFDGHSRSNIRILVVEDEAIVALDLTQRLEDLGYEVTGTAATGAEALALAHSTRPTLLFMDITIQGPIDGVETARQLVSRMDVPIIFLTAHTDTSTIQRAKQARAYGYLIKPFDERELISTIEMAVSRHSSDVPARLLEKAIETAGIGVAIASLPAHRITMCNPAFERLAGYPSAEIIGRSAWFLEGGKPDGSVREPLRRAIEDGREGPVNCRLSRRDGSMFPVGVAVSSVRNSSGEATHSLLCVSEVSD